MKPSERCEYCGHPLGFSPQGDYCTNPECTYVDGTYIGKRVIDDPVLLSERLRKHSDGFQASLYADRAVVLESALAAKDAEIERLREDVLEKLQRLSLRRYDARNFRHEEQVISAQALDDVITALAKTPAAPDAAIIGPDGKGSATGANPLAAPARSYCCGSGGST